MACGKGLARSTEPVGEACGWRGRLKLGVPAIAALVLALALNVLVSAPTSAAGPPYSPIVIDNVSTTQNTIYSWVGANGAETGGTVASGVSGSGLLGGSRVITVDNQGDPSQSGQSAFFAGVGLPYSGAVGFPICYQATAQNGSTGPGSIWWDGSASTSSFNPTGLNGVDLTGNGIWNSLRLDAAKNGGVSGFTITVYTDATHYSTYTFTLPFFNNGVCGPSDPATSIIPFSSFVQGTTATGPADFADVGGIRIDYQQSGGNGPFITLFETHSTTKPTLNLPSDITTPATSSSGATVTFSASATDTVDGTLTPTCTPSSGSTFAIGKTTVNCSVTDSQGNTAQGSFIVNVTALSTQTTADSQSATFSPSDQNVSLSATVKASGNPVKIGTVSFTVFDSQNNPVGKGVSQSIGSDGTASALFVVPGGTSPGSYTITASYTDSSGQYAGSSNTGTLTISQAAPNLTFDLSSLPATTYGDSAFSVAGYASSDSTAAITFALGNGSQGCAVTSSGEVTITGAGTCVIEASQAANTDYTKAGPISQSFTIAKATPTIDWKSSFGFTYGTALSSSELDATSPVGGTFSYTYSGSTAGGDQVNGVATTGLVLPAGDYTLTATFTPSEANLSNYNQASANAGLTVDPASLTVTADDASMAYGGPAPTYTASIEGYVNGDGLGDLTGSLSCRVLDNLGNGVDVDSAAAGSYVIDCSPSTYADPNYEITYQPGTLTIDPLGTTTKPEDAAIVYGATSVTLNATVTAANPAIAVDEGKITFSITTTDDETTLCTSGPATVSQGSVSDVACAFSQAPAAGTYTIHAAYSDSAGNFSESAGTATLTVGAVQTLTVVTSNPTIVTGTTTVQLSATVTATGVAVNEGKVTFVVTDSRGVEIGNSGVSGAVGSNGTATATFSLPANTPLGVYTITASYHDSNGNFLDSQGSGGLTITNGITVVGGNPIIVHHNYWALVRIQVTNAVGVNLSSRTLKVTSQNLAPTSQVWDGKNGNFVYAFQYASGGYQLSINSRPLSIGDYTLSFSIAGDPMVHTVTIRVVP